MMGLQTNGLEPFFLQVQPGNINFYRQFLKRRRKNLEVKLTQNI